MLFKFKCREKCRGFCVVLKKIAAFSLIEVNLVMIVMGILTYSLINFSRYAIKTNRDRITIANIERINRAIGQFILNHGYLPYPHIINYPELNVRQSGGDNFGREAIALSEDVFYSIIFSDTHTDLLYRKAIGIVPFLTLGLRECDVRDGNGNYFTYVINILMGKRGGYVNMPPLAGLDHDRVYELLFDPDDNKEKRVDICGAKLYENDSGTVLPLLKNKLRGVFRNLNLTREKKSDEHGNFIKDEYYNSIMQDLSCYFYDTIHVYDKRGRDLLLAAAENRYSTWRVVVGGRRSRHESQSVIPDRAIGYERVIGIERGMRRVRDRQFDVCDTIAFVLVSHGPNGGWFKPDGTRQELKAKVSCTHKKENASESNKFYESGDTSAGFDDYIYVANKFAFLRHYCKHDCNSCSRLV